MVAHGCFWTERRGELVILGEVGVWDEQPDGIEHGRLGRSGELALQHIDEGVRVLWAKADGNAQDPGSPGGGGYRIQDLCEHSVTWRPSDCHPWPQCLPVPVRPPFGQQPSFWGVDNGLREGLFAASVPFRCQRGKPAHCTLDLMNAPSATLTKSDSGRVRSL